MRPRIHGVRLSVAYSSFLAYLQSGGQLFPARCTAKHRRLLSDDQEPPALSQTVPTDAANLCCTMMGSFVPEPFTIQVHTKMHVQVERVQLQ